MNDAQLSQTAVRTKTRQPGLLVKPMQIVLSSYTSQKLRANEHSRKDLDSDFRRNDSEC